MSNNPKSKDLHDRELTRYETLELGWSMRELSEAFTSRTGWETLNHANKALSYINEFIGKIVPTPDLTEEDGNLAMALHTYMRKGMDCPLGTLLYNLISENKGLPIWYAFCKEVVSCEKQLKEKNRKMTAENAASIHRRAIHVAEGIYRSGRSSSGDLFMLSALQMWETDFPNAIDWVRDGEKE